MVIDGRWQGRWKPSDDDDDGGRFVRKETHYREAPEPFVSGRYHLYVAWTCPWAHRVLLVRALKGLAPSIPVHFVQPELSDQGWTFGDAGDPRTGARHLWQVYVAGDPGFSGRATVPLLVDTVTGRPVNNESSSLLRLLDALPSDAPALAPTEQLPAIDALGEALYHRLNNGVYRAGFATTQAAYDEAVRDVFAALDEMEQRLGDGRPWLLGDRLTEADLRLFVTTVRFEAAYHGLFKCNLRHLAAYPFVSAHGRRLLALPGVAATFDLEATKRGYYSIARLNPSGVVPAGPDGPFADR